MLVRWKSAFVAMLVVAAGFATAMDISDELSDELQMGWKMGLRPRQSSQNLQFFDESLGGAGAPAVYLYISLSLSLSVHRVHAIHWDGR